MTGFNSKRQMAQDKATTRPVEADYTSQVAYTRALEMYCDSLAQPAQWPVEHCEAGPKHCPVCEKEAQPVQEPTLQEQLDKAYVDWDKANADWLKANANVGKAKADCHKTNAEITRIGQLIKEKNCG
jgi:hypothetical protein